MVERAQGQEPKRMRQFIRLNKIPQIVGKGRTQLAEDIKAGLLKISRIGPRSVGAYEDDIADYQGKLIEAYNKTTAA